MKFTKIFNHFPTPKFLDLPFSGISILDLSIRCIQFGKKRSELYVKKYTSMDISPGLVVSGHINNKEQMILALSALKKKLELDYVKVSVPEEKAYLFTTKVPPEVKREEVISVVESKMEENVPVSPGELFYDYNLIDHREKGHIDIVVSAIQKNLINAYVEMITSSGLSLLSLEIESQAIARAIIPEKISDTILIVNFGKEKVGLYVASVRVVRFTSTVSLTDNFQNDPAYLWKEIQKLYTYWHTLKENKDKPDKKIIQIIVCGENLEDPIIRYLSTQNETPVAIANVWINALDINTVVPEIPFSDSLLYTGAIGLALPNDVLI